MKDGWHHLFSGPDWCPTQVPVLLSSSLTSLLLRFLYVDRLDATNNLAERQLEPAVVTRKTSGCNRTGDSTEPHAIPSSVLVTCRQPKRPILDYLVELQRSPDTPPPLLIDSDDIPP